MHACVRKELIERENKNKKRINTQENQPNLYFIHFHFRQISGQLCHEEVSAMNDPSPDLIKDANVHRLLNESHLSYRELFRRLDKNHDGKIYADQLIELLEKVGVETSTKNRWTIARVSVEMILF
jgi:hypothetical protein